MADRISYAEACREAATDMQYLGEGATVYAPHEGHPARVVYLETAAALRELAVLVAEAEQAVVNAGPLSGDLAILRVFAELVLKLAAGYHAPAPEEGTSND